MGSLPVASKSIPVSHGTSFVSEVDVGFFLTFVEFSSLFRVPRIFLDLLSGFWVFSLLEGLFLNFVSVFQFVGLFYNFEKLSHRSFPNVTYLWSMLRQLLTWHEMALHVPKFTWTFCVLRALLLMWHSESAWHTPKSSWAFFSPRALLLT